MELKRAGSQPSQKGPAKTFTGTVRIDRCIRRRPPARVACASVTFEPGARTAWHTDPLGQALIVTAGCGWTQCEGEPIVEIRAGDGIFVDLVRGMRHANATLPARSADTVAARAWIRDGNVGVLSFNDCCGYLGMDAEHVRRTIFRAVPCATRDDGVG